jgi:molybdopterin synthase catalytic subunit
MTSASQSRRNDVLVTVGPDRIDSGYLVDFAGGPRCGAVALFLGTVRDHSDGKPGVTRMEYEAYDDVVEQKITDIVAEAMERWDVVRVAAVHRVGALDVGEVSVAVAVGSEHRAEAFAASRYVIDELKARVPIWKKEHWSGGAEWVREQG